MIGSVRGEVLERSATGEVLVEVGGVGGPLAGGAHQEGAFSGGMDLDQWADAEPPGGATPKPTTGARPARE